MGKFSLFNSLFILYFVECLWNPFMGYCNLHAHQPYTEVGETHHVDSRPIRSDVGQREGGCFLTVS